MEYRSKMEPLKIILFTFLLLYAVMAQQFYRQENFCRTPDNLIGVCTALSSCPSIVQFYGNNAGSQQAVAFLLATKRSCGNRIFQGDPVVCCSDTYSGNTQTNFNGIQSNGQTNAPVSSQTNFNAEQFQPNPNNPFLVNQNNFGLQRPTSSPADVFTTYIPATRKPTTTHRPTTTQRVIATTTEPFRDTTFNTQNTAERFNECRGPDARLGNCKALSDCPELLYRLQQDPNNRLFAGFLRESHQACGEAYAIVCCPARRGFHSNKPVFIPDPTPTLKPIQTPEARILLPKEGCGQSAVVHRKIVGGEPARLGSWPWIALLGYDDGLGGTNFRCGGSLITKRHVLTAAHCIQNSLKLVRLGEHDLATTTETIHVDVKVKRSKKHAKYDRNDGHNDIAILYLERDVQFTDTIRPVCVPKYEEIQPRTLVDYHPFVAGWGKTKEGGNSSDILREVQIPILANGECKKRYQARSRLKSEKQFDDAIICAGYLAGGKDSCQGDSGGPLVLPNKLENGLFYYNLLGIVSYGIGCAQAGAPGIYASVPHFANWVRERIAEKI